MMFPELRREEPRSQRTGRTGDQTPRVGDRGLVLNIWVLRSSLNIILIENVSQYHFDIYVKNQFNFNKSWFKCQFFFFWNRKSRCQNFTWQKKPLELRTTKIPEDQNISILIFSIIMISRLPHLNPSIPICSLFCSWGIFPQGEICLFLTFHLLCTYNTTTIQYVNIYFHIFLHSTFCILDSIIYEYYTL